MIDGLAVQHAARAAGVVGHHAADGRATGGRDVGGKAQLERRELRVQFVQYDAGLNPRPTLFGVYFQQPVVMLGNVDLQTAADGLTTLRGAPATHRNGALVPAADLQRLLNILAGLGDDGARGVDLIHASVGRIQRTREGIETHLTGECRAQILFERAHSADRPLRNASIPRAKISPPLAKETRNVPSPAGP